MTRRYIAGVLALLISAGSANAQVTCAGAWPPSSTGIAPGNVASATDVMANFNYLYNCLTGITLPSAATPRSYLAGLGLSTTGSSTSLTIASGQAADGTNSQLMALAASLTKTTSSWAVGTGQGGLDTGSIANNTWYHVWLIERPDTGVVDVLISLSATSPTMPTNYTLKRRIGSVQTDGSAQWVGFVQDGDLFQWLTFVASSATNPGTSAVSRTLAVPIGINVQARIQPVFLNLGAAGLSYVRLSDLATADTVPSASNSDMPGANNGSGQLSLAASVMDVRTNTSAQIRTRLSYSDGNVSLTINTLGWIDRRGRDN